MAALAVAGATCFKKHCHHSSLFQLRKLRNLKVAQAERLQANASARNFGVLRRGFAMLVVASFIGVIVVVGAAGVVVGSERELRRMVIVGADEHVQMRTRRTENNQQAEGNSCNMFYGSKHNKWLGCVGTTATFFISIGYNYQDVCSQGSKI